MSKKWTTRIARRLSRAEQTARVRIARDELRHLRELSRTIDALETEIAGLTAQVAPQLLAEPGFGPLTAAKLIGEIAGVQRFSSDAKLARAGAIAPIPVSSGTTNRDAIRRLKRHLARRTWHPLQPPTPDKTTLSPSTS